MPREPPVTSATFLASFDIHSPLVFCKPSVKADFLVDEDAAWRFRFVCDAPLMPGDAGV
jgi:hypothetical protein